MNYTLPRNLKEEIDPSLRLKVYKEALNRLETVDVNDRIGVGLCCLLPAVLWNLKSVLDECPDGSEWYSDDTQKVFNEAAPYIHNIVHSDFGYGSPEREEMRRESLKQIIKSMEENNNGTA